MGKKARQKQALRLNNPTHSTMIDSGTDAEKAVVKKDLIQTVLVNLLFVGLLIGLHYWNVANDYRLDKFISNLINI